MGTRLNGNSVSNSSTKGWTCNHQRRHQMYRSYGDAKGGMLQGSASTDISTASAFMVRVLVCMPLQMHFLYPGKDLDRRSLPQARSGAWACAEPLDHFDMCNAGSQSNYRETHCFNAPCSSPPVWAKMANQLPPDRLCLAWVPCWLWQAADDLLLALLHPAPAQLPSDALQQQVRPVHLHYVALRQPRGMAAASEWDGCQQLTAAGTLSQQEGGAAAAWQRGMVHSKRLRGLGCRPGSAPQFHTSWAPSTTAIGLPTNQPHTPQQFYKILIETAHQ